ncbi:MAG TPA: hypothetical protein VGR55_19510 [Candidatus Acidoferrum sp.]|nr:hypothetical protein [Candidatus Acidoferrum sp.]
MRALRPIRKRRSETGIALLIAIFVLLLISVVAIALIVSSNTESALAGNYRSSTGVYYAALAGVEEARARLQPNDPNSFKTTWAAFYPAPGATLPIGTVGYVLNPSPTDNPSPGAMFAAYPDTEYDNEFGPGALGAANVQTTQSVWNRNPLSGLPFGGPLYKWARINAVSEKSLNLDVDADGQPDSITPLYYDNTNRIFSNNPAAGWQALELTALAVLPNGSQKLLQYLTAPQRITLPPFLATLSLLDDPGNSITFHAPAANASYAIKGDDQDCSGTLTGPKYPAVGVFNNPDQNDVINGIPAAYRTNYTGALNPPLINPPDVERIDGTFPANLQIPAQLNALAQTIIQNADAVVPQGSNSTQIAYLSSLHMSSSNVLTVVANGDLDISNWSSDGYGLLLVTGTFTYDPDTAWNGVILVIGQGKVAGNHQQFKEINGAMLVAKTRDATGNPLATLGGASVVFDDNMQGNGMRYSSCWIQKAQPKGGYKILSFHEISQ